MLDWDNPGLKWDLISDVKVYLTKKSVLSFLSRIWLLDALKRIAKIIPKSLLYKLI